MTKSQQQGILSRAVFADASSLRIPMLQVLDQDGTVRDDAELPAIDQPLAEKIYQTMLFIRVLDERMVAAQRQGRISFYMSSLGEEAAVIGSAAALDDEDMIFAQYREQGALRFRGFTLEQFMNQMFSNERDLGKGRQMPIHYGSAELNYMTISSPLGTQIPQATGYAYGQKMAAKGHCTLCYFGEGAASEGDFHAGLNMAAVAKVPVIFFCRNNGYAISTPVSEQYAGDGIAPRGVGYGMKSIRVDGNDVLAVLLATQKARKLAVEENEPVLIEAMSYRLGAHSTSDDPSGYRSRDEEEKWLALDPVARMRRWMLAQGWWSEEREQQEVEKLREEVLAAVKVAEKLPKPALKELFTDVYSDIPAHLQQQYEALKAHIEKYPQAYPATAGRG